MEARVMNKNFVWVLGGGVLLVVGVALYAMRSNQPTVTPEESPATVASETPASSSPATLKEVSFDVEGMTCESCKISVEQALLKVPGVQSALADVKLHKATVQYDPGTVTDPEVLKSECRKAIERVGYRVRA